MKPITSLIISFYNKIDLLELVLTALERQTYTNFEVIIADDGSKESVVTHIKKIRSKYSFKLKHVWHEDNGWQKNIILNRAIVESSGEYLIFIDGDCIPHPKFVQEHLESRKQNQVVSGRRVMLTKNVSDKLTKSKIKNGYLDFKVFFPLLFETIFKNRKTYLENMIRIRSKFLRRLLINDKVRGFWGCNFSVAKSDILKVNGFDERFLYPGFGEDVDLDNRLRRIGVFPASKKHLITQYHVYHKHFETMYEPNIKLKEENNKKKVTFTPFGIKKN